MMIIVIVIIITLMSVAQYVCVSMSHYSPVPLYSKISAEYTTTSNWFGCIPNDLSCAKTKRGKGSKSTGLELPCIHSIPYFATTCAPSTPNTPTNLYVFSL